MSMTVKELVESNLFQSINLSDDLNQEITKPFCCDLLSIAMSKTPAGGAWVTVMGNINTLAVASLTDAACIILAESAVLDGPASQKAKIENVTVLSTDMPIFEAALAVHNLIYG